MYAMQHRMIHPIPILSYPNLKVHYVVGANVCGQLRRDGRQPGGGAAAGRRVPRCQVRHHTPKL